MGGSRGVLTQGCIGAQSHRRSSGRAERLLLGGMMEEEDYDKQYYQGVLSPLLFFFFFLFSSQAQIMQNTSTEILSQFSPKKPFVCDEA